MSVTDRPPAPERDPGQDAPFITVRPPGPSSRSWLVRHARVAAPMGPRPTCSEGDLSARPSGIVYATAKGSNVTDVDGNRYVDLAGGFGAMLLGHRHPHVERALLLESERLWQALGDVYPADAKIALCERLAALHPSRQAQVILAQSGSDAIAAALKTALLATGKPGVLAFGHAYHGLGYGALAACGLRESYRAPFNAQLNPHVWFVDYPTSSEHLERVLTQVGERLAAQPIGAVLVEPILGRGGVVIPPEQFLPELARLTHAQGALLIADEIWTGLGRSGAWLFSARDGLFPDLVCLGKGLGGGLPISAVIGSSQLMQNWSREAEVVHTSTFAGTPLACATAIATLDALSREGLVERSQALGAEFRDRLALDLATRAPTLTVRGQGLMIALDLGAGPGKAGLLARALLERGYITSTGGGQREVLVLTPPLTISAPLLLDAASAIAESGWSPVRVSLLERSDALHAEVRAFAAGTSAQSFADLARKIAEFQAEFSPGFARLLGAAGAPDSVERLPGVPSEVFALTRVAVHPEALDVVRFMTSGTSSGARGVHAPRVTDTYRALSLAFGRDALLTSAVPTYVVALAPRPTIPASSSLGFMMALFMEHFDPGSAPVGDLEARFLMDERGLDLAALEQVLQQTRKSGQPLLVLATSFALVELLDRLSARTLGAHEQTTVMQTGGFKGKSREIPAHELRAGVARAFGIPEASVVGEYGMTELTSQMYEATLRGSALHARHEGQPGRYYEPPWLRVISVDPITLEPVADGEIGIARIIDLGNVDSAVCVQTRDLVRRHDSGFELLGRAPGALPRGCSLSIEEFLAGSRQAPVSRAEIQTPPASHRTSMAVSDYAKRRVRLEPLLTAARQLADPSHSLGQAARHALARSSDLSSQGIDFALKNSLETHPSEAELERLLSSAPECPRAHVLLSAGVFTAAHRAIAIALGASEHVFVRPSRRDPEMARLLLKGAPGCFTLVDTLAPASGEHVWAYGRDQTLDQLALELPANVVLHRHGAGFGVALLTESDELDLAGLAEALARDIVLFDQRGCLSPRVLLVQGSQGLAERAAAALASALSSFEQRVPLGQLQPSELAEIAQYRDSARYAAQLSPAGRGFVSLADADAWLLPPIGRNLHVLATRDALPLLERCKRQITTVGVHASAACERAIVHALPGVRIAAFGRMQTPPFDGPVDRRLE